MIRVGARITKKSLFIRIVGTSRQILYFNLAVGFNKPVNVFAEHCFYFVVNYPQKLPAGMGTFKGINIIKCWDSKLEQQSN